MAPRASKAEVAKTDEPEVLPELKRIHTEDLANITSFEDAARFLTKNGYTIEQSAELLGDGFAPVDKKDLVNVPFIVLKATLHDSKDFLGSQFALVRVMTKDGRKLFFTDGSTGVKAQVEMLNGARQGGASGMWCWKGLTFSKYNPVGEDGSYILDPKTGEKINATTFYFDTTAA